MKYESRRRNPPKIKTCNPTGWLRMHVWKMCLRRTKSTIISWEGSFEPPHDKTNNVHPAKIPASAQSDQSLRWAHTDFVGFDMRWLILSFDMMYFQIYGQQKNICGRFRTVWKHTWTNRIFCQYTGRKSILWLILDHYIITQLRNKLDGCGWWPWPWSPSNVLDCIHILLSWLVSLLQERQKYVVWVNKIKTTPPIFPGKTHGIFKLNTLHLICSVVVKQTSPLRDVNQTLRWPVNNFVYLWLRLRIMDVVHLCMNHLGTK